MSNKIKIYLPNGKVYKMALKDNNDVVDEKVITSIRQLFGEAESISFEVEPDPVESKKNGMKNITLILWGDVLKNSYITVEQY